MAAAFFLCGLADWAVFCVLVTMVTDWYCLALTTTTTKLTVVVHDIWPSETEHKDSERKRGEESERRAYDE